MNAGGELLARGDIAKLAMLCDALTERKIYACGLAEHRLDGDAVEPAGEGWLLLRTGTGHPASGKDYKGGVGLLLSPAAARKWRAHGGVVRLVSGHLLSAELPMADGTVITVVVFRWPPHDREQGERREAAIRETQRLVSGLKKGEPLLLLGDANGDPGSVELAGVTGPCGQGETTHGGEQLLDFATELGLRLMGTYFPKPAGRPQTWQHPGRRWYTLDHVLTRGRHACWVTDVDAKTLAECSSDHRLVQVTVNPARGRGGHVRRGLRRAANAHGAERHAVDKLRDPEIRRSFQGAVADGLEGVTPASQAARGLDGAERELVGAVRAAADATLGRVPRAGSSGGGPATQAKCGRWRRRGAGRRSARTTPRRSARRRSG